MSYSIECYCHVGTLYTLYQLTLCYRCLWECAIRGMLGSTSLTWLSPYCTFAVLPACTLGDKLDHAYFVSTLLLCPRSCCQCAMSFNGYSIHLTVYNARVMRVNDTMIHLQSCKVNMSKLSSNSKVNLMYEDTTSWTSTMTNIFRLPPTDRFMYTAPI